LEKDIDIAFRLASIGASPGTIAAALGITVKEFQSLDRYNETMKLAVESGRAKGCGEVLQALFASAVNGKSIEAMKYYLSIQSPDYRVDKAAVEINNNTLALPSAAEALRILRADPANRSLPIEDQNDGT
jgi:hypothetical protein